MFIITGGGSGIGGALAHTLAARGQDVIIAGRRQSMLDAVSQNFPNIQTCCADVTEAAGRHQVLSRIQHLSEISGIIHNAGILEPIAPLAQLDEAAWRHTLETNLMAPLLLTHALCADKTVHRVLHISSGAATIPIEAWSAYCVSKAALSMLTRCYQVEYPAQDALAVASVKPGIVDTDMQYIARHGAMMAQEKRDFFNQLHAQNRLLSPETVAAFLCWLVLDVPRAQYVSQEWDIYDTSHHASWLAAPHVVPSIDISDNT